MTTSPKTGDPELGRKIAARREELGMSRKALAEATDLSYPYIAQIETAYRLPSTKHQFVLAKALGWSLDELFGTVDETRAEPAKETPRRSKKPSIDEAVDLAATEIERLPAGVRLDALTRLQLRIMQGVTEHQARRRS